LAYIANLGLDATSRKLGLTLRMPKLYVAKAWGLRCEALAVEANTTPAASLVLI